MFIILPHAAEVNGNRGFPGRMTERAAISPEKLANHPKATSSSIMIANPATMPIVAV
jgi:hypothetical protein